MAAGVVVTLTTVIAAQPEAMVYVIVAVPVATPVTRPEPEPIVATDGLLLVHVPAGVASVKVIFDPMQTTEVPPIAAGVGLMLTVTAPSVPQHPAADCARK
jgi:hypothetical protein